MSTEPPALYTKTADTIAQEIEDALAADGWQGADGGAGRGLVRLFGRLSELIATRLNQAPDKHFLAFLNEAGIDLLPPRPAAAELMFTPAKEVTTLVRVPAGTQVASKQTETQAEVVFETERELIVSPSALVRVIACDSVTISDRTTEATGPVGEISFPTFRGEAERERILYLGDDDLFEFADEASRKNATVTLNFHFTALARPDQDGWELEWRYWNGSTWAKLERLEQVPKTITDGTEGFSHDGAVVFTKLPALVKTTIGDHQSYWLACALTGGSSRAHLPVISSITGSRAIAGLDGVATDVTAFCATQGGAAFAPIAPADEFLPLGQRPGRLDAFYLASNEAFSKDGADITIALDGLSGLEAPLRDLLAVRAPAASVIEVPGPVKASSDSPPSEALGDLDLLSVEWEYYSTEGWTLMGTSNKDGSDVERLGFSDGSHAFTVKDTGGTPPAVTFKVPKAGGPDLLFAATRVNGQEGLWVRARIARGSYNVAAWTTKKADDTYVFHEAITYEPHVKRLAVGYSGYDASHDVGDIAYRAGRVDGMWQDYAAGEFAPFRAAEEVAALYLGFQPAFPAGEWIRLLVEVDETGETGEAGTDAFWEYWNGAAWTGLRVSDDTHGLRARGYVGFFGPADHRSYVAFGQDAFWLRCRPYLPPVADAGAAIQVTAKDGEATVTLDASASRAFDREQRVAQYHWSLAAADEPAAAGTLASPYLRVIRTNTVPAQNGVTIRDEVLGFSNGKPGQVFKLARVPVLPGASIAVREPDRPPDAELEQLQAELRGDDAQAEALGWGQPVAPGEGCWVRWRQVADFFTSTPTSRHFTLDPSSGEVRFGDGKQGKIPPVGADNIKAVAYRTHNGAGGNLAGGAINSLRNPSGDLAKIKTVTNLEAAAGGSPAETTPEVKQRGPQSLKHRGRAVTIEDYAWLAREASGEVAQAWCLPGRNPQGLTEPGWVTIVIIPKGTGIRPTPTQALCRYVDAYLSARALANLSYANQVLVKGPEYIRATVLAQVVAEVPEEADAVKLAVLQRLTQFLHPLTGGPDRAGWELGRDVYLSEVCAEIEAVPGVDHVAGVRLLASLQQQRIRLAWEPDAVPLAPLAIAAGSEVSTFDARIKLLLAEPVAADQPLTGVAVYGLKVDDQVNIVAADNSVVVASLGIASLTEAGITGGITFDEAFLPPPQAEWDRRAAVMSLDGRVRLPLAKDGIVMDGAGERVTGTGLQGFQPGDKACLVAGALRHPDLQFLPIAAVEPCEDRVFTPPGHLVYAGDHDIEMVLE